MVRSKDKTLLTDPWLVGSCYWRSWWNYPPVKPELIEGLVPDVIYLTHIHWDHFHGATLKRFPKDTRIVIPYERSTRIRRDLVKLGFTNLTELTHGSSYKIADDFQITSYQFSPWGDSAVVIEAEGITILNANDAKFMGAPLNQIIKKHGAFDFALRSHSSANDRVCYQYTDSEKPTYQEDSSIYAKSFYNFMEKVQPRYAIPFASNCCHLHKETFRFNPLVETPVKVENYVNDRGGFSNTELKIMVSGDSWDSVNGFNIPENTFFTERDFHLQNYLRENTDKLEATYKLEDKVSVRFEEFDRFFSKFLAATPWFTKRSFKGHPIIFVARNGDNTDYFLLDVYTGERTQLDESSLPDNPITYEMTSVILKRAMALNMFSHVGISKRVTYKSRKQDTKHLKKLKNLLSAYEYEVLPLSRLFSLRTIRVYSRRWREILLYVQLLIGIRRGKSLHELEAIQLGQKD